MFTKIRVLVAVVTIQLVYGQQEPPLPAFPDECKSPPIVRTSPVDCCEVPLLFTEEDMKACGFEHHKGPPGGPPPPGHRRTGPPPNDCKKELCLFSNKNMAKGDNPDLEAVNKFIDTWAGDKDDLKEVASLVKTRCVREDLPGPPHACQAGKMMFCMTSSVLDNCPTWSKSEDCTSLRTHMDGCRTAILRQSQQLRSNSSP